MGENKRLAGIELGGTKIVMVLGEGTRIVERERIPTTTPQQSFAAVNEVLREWEAAAPLAAIGIASFGPIRVDPRAADYGTILETPKPGWAFAPVLGSIERRADCPVAVDTDVNGAALAEYALGAAQGCANSIYLTIGTGIGGGVLVDGVPVHGAMHPEIGHLRLRRQPGDAFAGVCRFHGDCLEGLVSGPALEARLPRHPGEMTPDDPAWEPVAADLAELLAQLVLSLSPARILVGGGVTMRQPHLLAMARARLPALLGGYLPEVDEARIADMVRLPALGDDAGPTGALVLASMALERARAA